MSALAAWITSERRNTHSAVSRDSDCPILHALVYHWFVSNCKLLG